MTNGNALSLSKIINGVLVAVLAGGLVYMMQTRDSGIAIDARLEARVERLESDTTEIRAWVKDLHTLLVRGQPVPVREP